MDRFELKADGVFLKTQGGGEMRIASRIQATFTGRHDDGQWSLTLRFLDLSGNVITWNMPRKLLLDARSVCGELLNRGFREISPSHMNEFVEYLQNAAPKDSIRITGRTGWHDSTFVLPDSTFPKEA